MVMDLPAPTRCDSGPGSESWVGVKLLVGRAPPKVHAASQAALSSHPGSTGCAFAVPSHHS